MQHMLHIYFLMIFLVHLQHYPGAENCCKAHQWRTGGSTAMQHRLRSEEGKSREAQAHMAPGKQKESV